MIRLAHASRASVSWQVFRVAATYVGTVVGAGFASGQETLRFFAAYGRTGLVGVALATFLFCLYGILIMDLGRRLNARSHRDILHHACGPTVGRIMDLVITLFLGVTLTVMVAGGGAVAAEQLGMPRVVGTLVTAGLAGLTILSGMRGIMAANTVVVPLLTLAVVGLTSATIHLYGLSPILERTVAWPGLAPVRSWMLAALLYVGYNLVLSISVLGPLGAAVQSRRVLVVGGLTGGLVLGALATGISLALSAHMPEISMVEMPLLYLARLHPSLVQWFYTAILWAEIYTTAIACAYGFASRTAEAVPISYRHVVIIVTGLALLGSGFGFSTLLSILYPLFGFITLIVLFALAAMPFRRAPIG